MSRELITAEPVTDVRRIARVMADQDLSAMLIVTPPQELVGIVSRGNLLPAITNTPPLGLGRASSFDWPARPDRSARRFTRSGDRIQCDHLREPPELHRSARS